MHGVVDMGQQHVTRTKLRCHQSVFCPGVWSRVRRLLYDYINRAWMCDSALRLNQYMWLLPKLALTYI